MKRLRVLALMHPDLVPPPDAASMSAEDRFRFKTEYDVTSTLQQLGHEVHALGVQDDAQVRDAHGERSIDFQGGQWAFFLQGHQSALAGSRGRRGLGSLRSKNPDDAVTRVRTLGRAGAAPCG